MTSPTASAPGKVNFLQLADQCRVIKTSPAWTEVERTLQWIEESRRTNKEIDPADERLDYVNRFSKLLRESAPLISNALCCGAIVGACLKTGSRGVRVLNGLSAISHGFHFVEADSGTIAQNLEQVRVMLAGEIPKLKDWSLPNLSIDEKPDSIASWTRVMHENLDAIDLAVADFTFDMPKYQQQAWSVWNERFNRLGFSRTVTFQATLAELFCAAADVPPTFALRFDLNVATIVEWSAMVAVASNADIPDGVPGSPPLPAIASSMPKWAAAIALHALGFRISFDDFMARVHTRLNLHSDIPSTALDKWKWLFSGPPSRASVLLITLGANSVVNGWRPLEGFSILATTQATCTKTVQVLPRRISDDADLVGWIGDVKANIAVLPLSLTHLAIEMPSTSMPPTLSNEVSDLVTTLRNVHNVNVVRLFAQSPTVSPADYGSDTFIIAKDVHDFASQLQRSSSRSAAR
ncbi:MAG: hypothetical protein ABJB66_13425 [Gemmatimonadaceae bacterium]